MILVIIASSGCLDTMRFNFYIEETGEHIDGNVYLGNKYLGSTEDGKLEVDKNEIYPGEISINGTYNGTPFAFYFDIEEQDIEEYSTIDYLIPLDELEMLSFKASDIDTEVIENEIFERINAERNKKDIIELKRSSILDDIAKKHSDDMVMRNYYAHDSPEGYDVYDRLQSEKIFYFTAAEDLNYISLLAPDTDIAKETVSGWIESPGHRIPVLDDNEPLIWDHIGIGVSCEDETYADGTTFPSCYITAIFVGFESTYEEKLEKDYLRYIDLYNPALGIEYDSELSIDFYSDGKVNLYIISDEDEYEKLLHGKSIDGIVSKRNINRYTDTINIKPGYGIVIDASSSFHDVEYKLSLRYNAM